MTKASPTRVMRQHPEVAQEVAKMATQDDAIRARRDEQFAQEELPATPSDQAALKAQMMGNMLNQQITEELGSMRIRMMEMQITINVQAQEIAQQAALIAELQAGHG